MWQNSQPNQDVRNYTHRFSSQVQPQLDLFSALHSAHHLRNLVHQMAYVKYHPIELAYCLDN